MPKRPQVVARQRRVRPVVPLMIAAAAVVGLSVWVASLGSGGSGDTSGSPSTTGSSTSIATDETVPTPDPITLDALTSPAFVETTIASYVIGYEVVENDLARIETWQVQRPYESLVVGERDGERISGTATSQTQLWTLLADRDGWLAIQPELHRAAFDQHPLVTMQTMIDLGYATEDGADEVIGRACRLFTTGQPLSAGVAKAPSDGESVEVCIDETGLVLREAWTIDGSIISVRTATSVDLTPDIDPATFDPSPMIDDAAEYAPLLATEAVPADEAMIAALQVDVTVPDGYSLDGTVVRSNTGTGGSGVIEVVRFYSDGVDLIEVAEVGVGSGDADLSTAGAIPVTVPADGAFGTEAEVWFAPDFRASALRVRLGDGSYIEIRGVNPASLVEIFRGLAIR